MRSAVIVIGLVSALLACAGAAYWAWQGVGTVEIGTHGWIALGLGAVLTFLLGAGWMALVFFSARRGDKKRAHQADRGHADHWRRPPDEA